MEVRLAWLSAILSGVAAIAGFLVAIAGFQTANEARKQTSIAYDEASLDRTGVIIRVCDEVRSKLMKTGDDLFLIDGKAGDTEYIYHEEREDLLAASSVRPTYFLECRITNSSRVPIFNVVFSSTISYHRDMLRKRRHNDDPIEVLAPGETRTFWVEAQTNDPIVFHEPDWVKYNRFPEMATVQSQPLQPRNDYFWTLRKSYDPLSSEAI